MFLEKKLLTILCVVLAIHTLAVHVRLMLLQETVIVTRHFQLLFVCLYELMRKQKMEIEKILTTIAHDGQCLH